MYIAYDKQNNRIDIDDAVKSEIYYCPICEGQVIVKEGKVNAKHFAHKSGECKDSWHYDMSEWHRQKQCYFPIENREIVISHNGKTHRADVLVNNTVIEFQHSPITAQEFMERNHFFNSLGYRVAWVFDVSTAYELESLTYSEDNNYLMIWKNPMRIFAQSPKISDYNKNFSLWFSWDSDFDEGDWINKVIWTPKDEYEQNNFNRFIISSFPIDLESNIDIDDFFRSKEDYFKLKLYELKKSHPYFVKYIGEKGHPRSAYTCPKTNKFGVKMFSENGCLYCRYCYMIAEKNRPDSNKKAIYCCYPNQVRELCEGHPGYECSDAPIYEL